MEPTNQYVYVVASSYNDYNQHGDYFEGVFRAPPTAEQLIKLLEINEHYATKLYEEGTVTIEHYTTYEIFRMDLL